MRILRRDLSIKTFFSIWARVINCILNEVFVSKEILTLSPLRVLSIYIPALIVENGHFVASCIKSVL